MPTQTCNRFGFIATGTNGRKWINGYYSSPLSPDVFFSNGRKKLSQQHQLVVTKFSYLLIIKAKSTIVTAFIKMHDFIKFKRIPLHFKCQLLNSTQFQRNHVRVPMCMNASATSSWISWISRRTFSPMSWAALTLRNGSTCNFYAASRKNTPSTLWNWM